MDAQSPIRDDASMEKEKPGRDEFQEVITSWDDEQPAQDVLDFRKKEAKLVKKLDVFIAPVMFLLMLISYLDRGSVPRKRMVMQDADSSRNIGFAATQGMIEDINLQGSDLNVCVPRRYLYTSITYSGSHRSPYQSSTLHTS